MKNIFPILKISILKDFQSKISKKRPSLAYMPFGLGSRRCPGYRFSRFEAFATLSVLVRQFRIRPAFEDDFFIQPSFGFVTKPDTEIWIKVESRL